MKVDDWAARATISGLPIPGQPDLARMRADRHLRLQQQLEAQGLDGLVLLVELAVAYATGAGRSRRGRRAGRAVPRRRHRGAGADAPFLYTPFWDGAPPSSPRPCARARSSPT